MSRHFAGRSFRSVLDVVELQPTVHPVPRAESRDHIVVRTAGQNSVLTKLYVGSISSISMTFKPRKSSMSITVPGFNTSSRRVSESFSGMHAMT